MGLCTSTNKKKNILGTLVVSCVMLQTLPYCCKDMHACMNLHSPCECTHAN